MIRTWYALNKILIALAREHMTKDRLTDDLVGHDISEAERAALTAGDTTGLYRLGANLIRRVFRSRFPI